MNTDIELVEELRKRNKDGRYDALIADAFNGMYHDFKTTIALPKMTLADALAQFPELKDLRQDVINGEYDEEWPDKKKKI
jgi:hypothetical protein